MTERAASAGKPDGMRAGGGLCPGVVGVVLAGGHGSRLGMDKTALRLPDRDQDLMTRAAELLSRLVADVRISCRADMPDRLARAGRFPVVPDIFPGEGVLRAVYSILKQVSHPCLIIPCDMPFLPEEALRVLLERRARRTEGRPVLTAYRQKETGFVETLVAVYEPESLPFFERALARGDYSLHRAVPPELRDCVDYGQEWASAFRNINMPEDLENARRMALAENESPAHALCGDKRITS